MYLITSFWESSADVRAYFKTPERAPNAPWMKDLDIYQAGPPEVFITQPVYSSPVNNVDLSSAAKCFIDGVPYKCCSQTKYTLKPGRLELFKDLFYNGQYGLRFANSQKGAVCTHCSTMKLQKSKELYLVTGFWASEEDFNAYYQQLERAKDHEFMSQLEEMLVTQPEFFATFPVMVY